MYGRGKQGKIRLHLSKRLGETMTEEEGSGERLQSSLVMGWDGAAGPYRGSTGGFL